MRTITPVSQVATSKTSTPTNSASPKLTTIRRVKITSTDDFNQILQAAVPVVLEGLDIGSCLEKWTDDYLKEAVGAEREVTHTVYRV